MPYTDPMMKGVLLYAPLIATSVSAFIVIIVAEPWRDAAASLGASFVCLIGLCLFVSSGIGARRWTGMGLWQALLLFAGTIVLVSAVGAADTQHALWGFAVDAMSAGFIVLALLVGVSVSNFPAKVRTTTAIGVVVVLVALWAVPSLRTNPEVRPSFAATAHVIAEAGSAGGVRQMVAGSGPNSFVYLWQLHAPISVRSSVFATERFPVGSGIIPTFIAEIGILASLLIVLAFLVRAAECIEKTVRRWNALPFADRMSGLILSTLPLMALIGLFFAPPSAPFLLGSFIALGASGGPSGDDQSKEGQGSRTIGRLIAALVAIAAGCVFYLAVAAVLYFYAGTLSVHGDLLRARNAATRSYSLSGDPQAARLSASIVRTLAHETAKRKTVEEVPPLYAEALAIIRSATIREPSHADNWSLFGAIAAEQYTATRDGSYFEIARGAFERARMRAPGDARIPLFQGQLYLLAGRLDDGISYLEESVALRPDIEEAASLLSSAQEAKRAMERK